MRHKFCLINFTALFLFLTVSVAGQDYQIFFSDRLYIYEFDVGTKHLDVFRSNGAIVSGGDSIFSNYTRCNDDVIYAIPPNGVAYYSDSTWAGYKCIISQNGDNILLNGNSDSIIFKSNAAVGDSWTFYQFSNGEKFIATVDSLVNDSIFNSQDSVKYISILRHDSFGAVIPDSLNNFVFKLSKSFGLILTTSIKHFPNQKIVYRLQGIDGVAGDQRITPASLFDFDIGDEFHYTGYAHVTLSTSRWVDEKRVVLGKTVTSTTVVYSIGDSVYTMWDYAGTVTRTLSYNVINESHPLYLNSFDSLFAKLPQSFFIGGEDYLTTWHRNVGNRRSILTVPCIRQISLIIPTNLHRTFGMCTGDYCNFPGASNLFVEGLGLYQEYSSLDSASGNYLCWKYMVYYRKGNETYGTPISFPIIANLENIKQEILPLKIFPSPVNEIATIEFSGKINSLNFYDTQMKKVQLDWISEGGKIIINCKELSDGLYFVFIKNDESYFSSKLIVSH